VICSQYLDGEHIYHPGQRQLVTADGRRAHSSEPESWRWGLFCACGAECPAAEEPAVQAALSLTTAEQQVRWGVETGAVQTAWPI